MPIYIAGIGEGKECDRSYYSNHDAVGPGPANKVETKVPCEVGLVCKRESLDTHYCQPANQTGKKCHILGHYCPFRSRIH